MMKKSIRTTIKAAVITTALIALATLGQIAIAKDIHKPINQQPHLSILGETGLVMLSGKNKDNSIVYAVWSLDGRIVLQRYYKPGVQYVEGPFAVKAGQVHTLELRWFDNGRIFIKTTQISVEVGGQITATLNIDFHPESISYTDN